jgi:hypothetical protein
MTATTTTADDARSISNYRNDIACQVVTTPQRTRQRRGVVARRRSPRPPLWVRACDQPPGLREINEALLWGH